MCRFNGDIIRRVSKVTVQLGAPDVHKTPILSCLILCNVEIFTDQLYKSVVLLLCGGNLQTKKITDSLHEELNLILHDLNFIGQLRSIKTSKRNVSSLAFVIYTHLY